MVDERYAHVNDRRVRLPKSGPIPLPPQRIRDLDSWLGCFTNWEKQAPLAGDRRSLGPARCRALLDRAGVPTPSGPVVQVAGTKGKGSTVLWMESLLRARAQPCAATISPHLESITERIRIDGIELSEAEIIDGLRLLHPHLIDQKQPDSHAPTFFDLWIALFIERAHQAGNRWILLEVGLGGPLDSTCAIGHDVGVLTTVDLDHQAILGESIQEITREKSRIATAGKPFIIAEGTHSDLAAEIAVSHGAIPEVISDDDRLPPSVLFPQRLNAAVALTALESVPGVKPWTVDEIQTATDLIELPGRLELLSGPPPLLLDGAHTPLSLAAFAGCFQSYCGSVPGALLLGMMQDKDAISSLAPVTKLIPPPSIVSITVPSTRGLPASQLANIIESLGIHCLPLDEPKQGLAWLMEKAAAGVPTAATGSMLLAGWIRRHWGEPLH